MASSQVDSHPIALSRLKHIDDGALALCDDLINLLGKKNQTGETANPTTRAKLWDRVFQHGWDTGSFNPPPGPFPERQRSDSTLHVGVFNRDLPLSTAAKRKANGSTGGARPPPHRRAGAPAFLRPNQDPDGFGLVWQTVDESNMAVGSGYVQFHNGWTPQQARAETAAHFDRHEHARIGEYNAALVVFWARARLVRYLHESRTAAGVAIKVEEAVLPSVENGPAEDHGAL